MDIYGSAPLTVLYKSWHNTGENSANSSGSDLTCTGRAKVTPLLGKICSLACEVNRVRANAELQTAANG